MLPSSLDYIFKKNFSLFYILKHQNFLGYLFGYKIFVLQSHPPLYKNAKILAFLGGGCYIGISLDGFLDFRGYFVRL